MKLKSAAAVAVARGPAAPSVVRRRKPKAQAPAKPMGTSGTLHGRIHQVAQPSAQVAQPSAQQAAKLARRDRVVLDHLPLVRAIAIRVHENLPVHVDLDDLVHAGVLGLFDAVTKYDHSKNVAFHAYAKHRIKGAILDSLRQLDWASRDLRKRQKQVDAATRELALKLGRNPSETEVAEQMGLSPERWRRVSMEL